MRDDLKTFTCLLLVYILSNCIEIGVGQGDRSPLVFFLTGGVSIAGGVAYPVNFTERDVSDDD